MKHDKKGEIEEVEDIEKGENRVFMGLMEIIKR